MSEHAYSQSSSQDEGDHTVVTYPDRADCRLEELREANDQTHSEELEALQFRCNQLLREQDELRSTIWRLEAASLDDIPQDKVTDAEAGTLYGALVYAIEQWIYNLSLVYSQSHWQRLYSIYVHEMDDRKAMALFPKTLQDQTAQSFRELEGTEHLDLFFMTCFITETISSEVLEEKHPYGLRKEQITFIEETERSMASVLKWDELKIYKWRLNTYLGAMRSASFPDLEARLAKLTNKICSRVEDWMQRGGSKHGELRLSSRLVGQLKDGIVRAAIDLQHKVAMSPDRYGFWVPSLGKPADAQSLDFRDIDTWTKVDGSPHGTSAAGVLYPGLRRMQPDHGYHVITRPEVVIVRITRPIRQRSPQIVSPNVPSSPNTHVVLRTPVGSPQRASHSSTFLQRLIPSSPFSSVSYSKGPLRSVREGPVDERYGS